MNLIRTLAFSLLVFGIAKVRAKEFVDKPTGKKSLIATENPTKMFAPTSTLSKSSKSNKPRGGQRHSVIVERRTQPPPEFTTLASPSRRNIPGHWQPRTMRTSPERGPLDLTPRREQAPQRQASPPRQPRQRQEPRPGGNRDRSRSPRWA